MIGEGTLADVGELLALAYTYWYISIPLLLIFAHFFIRYRGFYGVVVL